MYFRVTFDVSESGVAFQLPWETGPLVVASEALMVKAATDSLRNLAPAVQSVMQLTEEALLIEIDDVTFVLNTLVRRCIENSGLTKTEILNRAGWNSHSALNTMLSGKHQPYPSKLNAFLKVFDLDFELVIRPRISSQRKLEVFKSNPERMTRLDDQLRSFCSGVFKANDV